MKQIDKFFHTQSMEGFTLNKQLTGYPSIDQPWLKYFQPDAINAPLPECTVYEYDNGLFCFVDREWIKTYNNVTSISDGHKHNKRNRVGSSEKSQGNSNHLYL